MKLCNDEGEVGCARASAKFNTVQILSTFATQSLEEVKEGVNALPKPLDGRGLGQLWMQLYVLRDRPKSEDVVVRAEKAGYKALVVTVDTPHLGRRRHNVKERFELPAGMEHANFKNPIDGKVALAPGNDASLNWQDTLPWLRKLTKMPILLKGVLCAEDADKAAELGVDGIIVSNHGGRQLDSAPATIEALGEVVEAVRGRCPVLFDGGVRNVCLDTRVLPLRLLTLCESGWRYLQGAGAGCQLCVCRQALALVPDLRRPGRCGKDVPVCVEPESYGPRMGLADRRVVQDLRR